MHYNFNEIHQSVICNTVLKAYVSQVEGNLWFTETKTKRRIPRGSGVEALCMKMCPVWVAYSRAQPRDARPLVSS